ncbi:hypothetical protein HY441_00180, partial [Candidatus Microgenomates bacterium]|nr:hypothetical protein [Candidatus Microgenomates bacterium]
LFHVKKLTRGAGFWLFVLVIFGILSLGVRLSLFHRTLEALPLPYAGLAKIFPFLNLSGVPVRMMVMVTLAAGVLVAMVLAKLNLSRLRSKVALAVLLLIMVIELWPAPLPLTASRHPDYVERLKALPSGAVVDNAAVSAPRALYHQTIHDKPLVFGYVSRLPKSVMDKDWVITHAILTDQYQRLCSEFRIRYITTPPFRPLKTTYPVIHQDQDALIYDLKDSPSC